MPEAIRIHFLKRHGAFRIMSSLASGIVVCGIREELLQFPGVIHLDHDITAPDELTVDIELWKCRPVGKYLEAFPDFRILENIDVREWLADGL